jgi:hypothetical protein
LDLYCCGGSSGESTFGDYSSSLLYDVYSYKDNELKMKLTETQFNNIEKYYKMYIKEQRKQKLDKIKNGS